jgi:hypothetical protein
LNPGSDANQIGIQVLEGLPETGAFLLSGSREHTSSVQGLADHHAHRLLPFRCGGSQLIELTCVNLDR